MIILAMMAADDIAVGKLFMTILWRGCLSLSIVFTDIDALGPTMPGAEIIRRDIGPQAIALGWSQDAMSERYRRHG